MDALFQHNLLSLILFAPTFGAALVQRAKLEPGHLSTTFALNLVAGALLTGLGVFTAAPLARFFHTPDAAPVFVVLSLGFLLNAPGRSILRATRRSRLD